MSADDLGHIATLVRAAKAMRRMVMRREDYDEPAEPETELDDAA